MVQAHPREYAFANAIEAIKLAGSFGRIRKYAPLALEARPIRITPPCLGELSYAFALPTVH